MAQVTATDTGTGESRPIEVGEGMNSFALSTNPMPEPSISGGDVTGGLLQQQMRQRSPLEDAGPPTPVPSHLPNPPGGDQFLRPRNAIELADDTKRRLTTLPWNQPDYTEPMATVAPLGGMRVPQSATQWFDPVAVMPEMAVKIPEVGPLKGFFSKFQSEVLPRLSEKPQQIGKLQSIVSKGFVSKDELEWMGFEKFIKEHQGQNVTRADVAKWFEDHQIKMAEKVTGGEPVMTAEEKETIAKAKQVMDDYNSRFKREYDALSEDRETRRKLYEFSNYGTSPAGLPAHLQDFPARRDEMLRLNRAAQAIKDLHQTEHTKYAGSYTIPGAKEHYREHHLIIPAATRPDTVPRQGPIDFGLQQKPPELKYAGDVNGPVAVYEGQYGNGGRLVLHDYSTHPNVENAGSESSKVWMEKGPYYARAEWYRSLEDAQEKARQEIERDTHTNDEMEYHHSHFDIKDYFLHSRGTIREIPGVGRTWFVDEAQSDAHQAAAKHGYRQRGDQAAASKALFSAKEKLDVAESAIKDAGADNGPLKVIQQSVTEQANKSVDDVLTDVASFFARSGASAHGGPAQRWASVLETHPQEVRAYIEAEIATAQAGIRNSAMESAPPIFPFRKTWEELGLRVALRDAVAHGASAIGWPTGQHILDIYDQALHDVKTLIIKTSERGYLHLQANNAAGYAIASHSLNNGSELKNYVGEANAKRLLAAPATYAKEALQRSIAFGPDEKFMMGNKGVGQQYDKTWVKQGNTIGKEHGAQVEMIPQPDTSPDFGRKLMPVFDRRPFIDPTGTGDFVRSEYKPEDFTVPEPPDWQPDENWEPDISKYEHTVKGTDGNFDELENNLSVNKVLLQKAKEAHPEFFESDEHPDQQRLFGGDRQGGNLKPGLTLDVRDVGGAYSYDWRVFAKNAEGEDLGEIVTVGDGSQEETAQNFKKFLEDRSHDQPTGWRYTWSEYPGDTNQSDWYDSPEEASRQADRKQATLDEYAESNQRDNYEEDRRSVARKAYRQWQRQEEAFQAQQDQLKAAHEGGQDALEIIARHKERARIVAGGGPTLEQLRQAHLASEDARYEAWKLEHPPDAADPKSLVHILRIPPKWAHEIATKGQPLPSLVAPLTGAGLSLMASHKREAAQPAR